MIPAVLVTLHRCSVPQLAHLWYLPNRVPIKMNSDDSLVKWASAEEITGGVASWEPHLLGGGGAEGPGGSRVQSWSVTLTQSHCSWRTVGYSVSNRNLKDLSCALLYLVRIDTSQGSSHPQSSFWRLLSQMLQKGKQWHKPCIQASSLTNSQTASELLLHMIMGWLSEMIILKSCFEQGPNPCKCKNPDPGESCEKPTQLKS